MKKLLEIRKALGLSQSEMAKLVGVTPTYISTIERGVNKPSRFLQEKLENISRNIGNSDSSTNIVNDIINPSISQVANNEAHVNVGHSNMDISRLLAIIESQQQTIASLLERLDSHK